MIIASASEISKAYGADLILKDVSFHISEGDRIGIIGDNGAGKTTLMSIIGGRLSYDSGELFMSSRVDLGYLRQHDNFSSENTVYQEMLSIFSELIAMEERIHQLSTVISEKSAGQEEVDKELSEYDGLTAEFERRNGFSFRSEVRGILMSMAFPESFYEKKISMLSGGERTRLALAGLLLRKPQLLLLDEPTNHLDIGTVKWLEQYLKNYAGTLVIVSHDRYFLDQTVNRIFEIQNNRLSVYEGNYTLYVKKKKQREDDALEKYEHQSREIKRQEEMIRRFRQHGTEKLAKRARSREKRLEHIERLEKPAASKKSMRIHFKEKFQSGNDVLTGNNLSMSFTDENERRNLFTNIDFQVKRGDRICIVGPNGVGKTTLLRIIMGRLIPDSGFVHYGQNVVPAYYDQGQALLHSQLTVLEELHDSYRLYSETELRKILGSFLFRNDDVFKQVNNLSGGEKARLSLLKLMLSGANLLIMDEPTNHLDISSKEAFEDSLPDYPGTVIIVSHDRYLLNKVPSMIWEMSPEGIENYPGGYDYYLEKKQSIASGKEYLGGLSKITSSEDDDEKSGQYDMSSKQAKMEARRRSKEEEAKRRRLERDLKDAEAKIESLEKEIQQIEHEMCSEEVFSDHVLSAACSDKLEKSKEALNEAYELWSDLHEEAAAE